MKKTSGISLVNSTALYPSRHQAGDPGLPLLVVENPLARAVISLQGAQVMAFKPSHRPEMLWVSPKALLESGKAIRGGIPLCLPWFGPGPDGKSAHGFARTREWTLAEARAMPDGSTYLALELRGDAAVSELWPHAFTFRLEVLVDNELKLGLTMENHSQQEAPLAFAFHTYFAVANVAEIRVGGLEGSTFIDKIEHSARKTHHGEVTINAVTDRVYLNVPAQQQLEMTTGRVRIESDAKCAVVWNAWTNDKNIADLGEGNHVGYLCVERGDMADHAVTLAPGKTYRTWMILADH
ncbi:MAG: D-hexose-6-phosphate mutarotase [Betaproteobacteria bacterium]